MTNWQILYKVEHRSWCRRIEDIDSSGRFDNISMAVERTSIAKKIEDILGNDTINTDVLRYIPFCSEYITRFSVQKRQLKIFFDFCDQVAGKMRKSSKIEVFLFCWFLLSSGRSSSKTKIPENVLTRAWGGCGGVHIKLRPLCLSVCLSVCVCVCVCDDII